MFYTSSFERAVHGGRRDCTKLTKSILMKTFTEFKRFMSSDNKLGVIFYPYDNSVIEPNILKYLNYKIRFSLRKYNLIYWNMLKQLYISSDDMFKFLKGEIRYRESIIALMTRVLRKNVAKNV